MFDTTSTVDPSTYDDFFTGHTKYVRDPGLKRSGYSKKSKTSRDAAESVDARAERKLHLFTLIVKTLQDYGDCTADEIAEILGMDRGSVRPRVIDLKQAGILEPSGVRRETWSGTLADVLRYRKGSL
jgi:hypothetical protein